MKLSLTLIFKTLAMLAVLASPVPAITKVTVDAYGKGGAPTFQIKDAVLAEESPQSHHDLWIIQGGVNDCFWFGATTSTLVQCYLGSLTAIADHATTCGAVVFFQELTPVIPAIIDPQAPKTAPHEPKIILLNRVLKRWTQERGLRMISVYQEFKPHWSATPEGWCIYKDSDSVHPNEKGNRALGRAWARAVRDVVNKLPEQTVKIAVFGDSITLALTSKEGDKPSDWLLRYLTMGE
jgi:lysophospholipase L1-like esterase